AFEWMLADRQQLDMGEVHALGVAHELVGELGIAETPVSLLRHPAPGAEVAFIDGDRRGPLARLAPAGEPTVVAPGMAGGKSAEHRRSPRRHLALEGEGIGFERQQLAAPGLDLELVELAQCQPGNEDLPDPAFDATAHGM